MAGIYIHIPFCKKACHYCDFHFSTSLKKRDAMVEAICEELELRKGEINEEVATIYFGGGTPSLLINEEIDKILKAVYSNYKISEDPEITLEANPDDLTESKIVDFSESQINRLSIGVQSFFEQDLKLMNRAHNENEALASIELAKQHFENISVDLMYGIPGMTNEQWINNVEKAIALNIPHLSCYVLTVEPKTALEHFIKKGIVPAVEDDAAQEHHAILIEMMRAAGYYNYELSSFCKPGWESKNNTAYWQGKPYLGVGPSAHSYDGKKRSWNISNNAIYIKKISAGELPLERETLSIQDTYNEYVMTRLRTANGISLTEIKENFGSKYTVYLNQQMQQHIDANVLIVKMNHVIVTKKGKFLTDGIAADLFSIN
jgi:oxygen-independent coproporphyrinogen-3 oxidase